MLAQQVDVPQAVRQQAAAPVGGRQIVRHDLAVQAPGLLGAGHRVGHRAGSDQPDRGIDAPHRLGEQVVLQLELRERHEAELPFTPGLVAHAPELDLVRFRMAVGRAQPPHRRGDGSVRVLDELRRGPRVAEARVDGDVRLDAEQPAERHELVRAHVVGLHRVPDRVHDGRALVGIADGVAPLVPGDEVAAGEAIDAGVQLPERGHDLRPEAFNVVRRHQRDGPNVKRARAGSRDLEPGVVAVASDFEPQPVLLIAGAELADDDGLAVGRSGPPDQSDVHGRTRRTGQDDPARVGPALSHRQSGLLDSVRLGAELHQGRVVAHVRSRGVHRDELRPGRPASSGATEAASFPTVPPVAPRAAEP